MIREIIGNYNINNMINLFKNFVVSYSYRISFLRVLLSVCDSFGFIAYSLNARGRENTRKILGFKDKFKGKRCFILGNGPSLNLVDLSLLENEYTFGLNRIYLLFKKTGFKTTFLVSVNKLVLEQFAGDINSLKMIKFISWKSRHLFKRDKSIVFIRSLVSPTFSKDLAIGSWEGCTVSYVAMQIAYYLGFSEVVLVGFDHDFKDKGTPFQELLSKGKDVNHFDQNYFGSGVRWNLPNLEVSEYAYRLAKENFEKDGRRILNATVGGKLEIFERVEFEKLFTK